MLAILPVVLSLSVASPAPSVSEISLENLVRHADLMVIGRIERVDRIVRSEPPVERLEKGELDWATWEYRLERMNELSIAELVVERVVEGPADLRSVRFLNLRMGVCDITSAKPGDRGLYFLEEDRIERTLPGFVGSIRAVTNGAALHRIMHVGRGGMPFVGEPTLPRVECWDDVVLPDALVKASTHAPRSRFIHHVPLDLLESEVRAHVARQLPFVRVSAPERGPRAEAWSLSVWGDGVVDAWRYGERLTELSVATNLEMPLALSRRIEEERFLALPERLGITADRARSIEIDVRTDTQRKRVVIGELPSTPDTADGDLSRALRIYGDVRALFDDPLASDDSLSGRVPTRRSDRA